MGFRQLTFSFQFSRVSRLMIPHNIRHIVFSNVSELRSLQPALDVSLLVPKGSILKFRSRRGTWRARMRPRLPGRARGGGAESRCQPGIKSRRGRWLRGTPRRRLCPARSGLHSLVRHPPHALGCLHGSAGNSAQHVLRQVLPLPRASRPSAARASASRARSDVASAAARETGCRTSLLSFVTRGTFLLRCTLIGEEHCAWAPSTRTRMHTHTCARGVLKSVGCMCS